MDKFGRRTMLRAGAAGLASLALGPRSVSASEVMTTVPPAERKLLFVFCAHGGAAIINGLLPVLESEVADAGLAGTLDVFSEAQVESVPGSAFRFVKPLAANAYSFLKPPPSMLDFVRKHGADAAVFCHDVSSVNHNVAQARSLSGAGANAGRTIMEAMAVRYGGGMLLPNCNMGTDGYIEHGVDVTLPAKARHEVITAPLLFATGTHGSRGLAHPPRPDALQRARRVRELLDRETVFANTFRRSPLVAHYLEQRSFGTRELEAAELVEKLLLLDPASAQEGLRPTAVTADLFKRFPGLAQNDVQAQTCLAFLLAYHGVATSLTFGFRSDPVITEADGVVTTPIAFDYSHSSHRIAQTAMWGHLAAQLDGLIDLLKQYDYLGDPSLGKMWDRSLIYVATDFGRTKTRPSAASSWSTGHDLNNGSLVISPLIQGNRVYGGVDPKTCLTYGFDRRTGAPDKGVVLEEAAVYGALAHALDIPFAGRQDCPAWLR
jgi:hypothetical protein